MMTTKTRYIAPAALTLALGCNVEKTAKLEVDKTEVNLGLDAEVCIDTNWHNHGNTQHLTCTANDVQLAQATNICVHVDPEDPTSACKAEPTCIEGTPLLFTADFEVVLTAQDRYDVGVYFATDGDPNGDGALSGQCVLNTIDGTNAPTTYVNNDAAPDTCGDIDDENNPQLMQLTIETTCTSNEDPDNPRVLLPYCTSWRQPGSNELCDEASDAYPGSPSKCSCNPDYAIDIFIEPGSASVTKAASEACVKFDVTVSNDTTSRSMTVDALSDSQFGDITNSANTALCGATTCGQSGTGMPGALPATVAGGGSYVCSFWATVPSSSTIHTNTVTATTTFDGTAEEETIYPTGTENILIDLDPATP